MKNGFYIETETSNLKEFNKKKKRFYNGKRLEARYMDFYVNANGYKERMYQDFITSTNTSVGDMYTIYFNA